MKLPVVRIASLLFVGTLSLAASALADPTQVTGTSTTTYPQYECGTEVNLSEPYLKADENAEALCHGNAKRVSDYEVTNTCIHTHIWNYSFMEVEVTALYECND